jgi:AcrR family transcriptional regulator
MKPLNNRSRTTRRRLLDSACKVFAQKGYRDATLRQICDRAGANIAAVNYHFGDKEHLYIEAWRHSFHRSLAAHPPDGGHPARPGCPAVPGPGDDAPPETRLRARVAALLRRISDEASCEFAIICTELANPTGLLGEAMRDTIQPLREKMTALVRELLGPRASDRQVRFCQISIMSQCLDVMRRRRLVRRLGKHRPLAINDLDAYADHIVTFSLAGIRAIREEAERGNP